MKQYLAKDIRNVAFTGHGSSGKTSLAEALLFLSGATDRQGKIADGNTFCDFDPEEIKRKASVTTSVAPLEWKNTKINIIDAPGLFDFEGGVAEALRAADTALITISGKSGVAVGATKAFKAANKLNKSKVFFVNKLDSENADFYKALDSLREAYGTSVCPLVVPYVVERKVQCYISLLEDKAYKYTNGKAAVVDMPDMGTVIDGLKTAINEAVAETSEDLLEKFFSGEAFTAEELAEGIEKGVESGAISPVFCGSAINLEGIDLLLDGLVKIAPSAETGAEKAVGEDGKEMDVKVSESDPAAAIVFKTIADPYVGKLSYFKVISGKIAQDSHLVNMRAGADERVSKVMTIRGKKQEDAAYIGAGDIGAAPKLALTNTGDTLCDASRKITLKSVDFPSPTLFMAVYPKVKGDEDKIVQGIHKLLEEDPTICLENRVETHQTVLSGLGEQHLDVIASKLKTKFAVDVVLVEPRVAYRETIRKKVTVEGKHKKQTGGHGQFGHVWIDFEPCDSDDLVFEERVVGGAVPRGYYPAVEKGLRECIVKGVLAGYPVVGLKATLFDGSYHPVDSNELSFKMAAAAAYKTGMAQASPVLLEPIGKLTVTIPDDAMGDIIGEVNKKRGRVLGMDAGEDGMQIVSAEVPMAEMADFSTLLRQTTQGRGTYALTFERYEDAPPMVSQKVIEQSKSDEEHE